MAGGSFADLDPDDASRLVSRFAAGELEGGVWERLPCRKAWGVVMRGVLSAFYSHPWAWNEIGYGGPAYPRGYMRLGAGGREPHQGAELGEDDPVEEVAAGGPWMSAGGSNKGRPRGAGLRRGVRLLAKGSVGPVDNDSRFLLDPHHRGLPNLPRMARYRDDDEVDLLVVGAGAGGCTLGAAPGAARMARRGARVRAVLGPRPRLGVR